MAARKTDRMSDLDFKLMDIAFKVVDFFSHHIDARVQTFGISPGMTVVDYGCGPGRYTTRFSALVGSTGCVYAVDIQELAIAEIQKKIDTLGWKNVQPILAHGYSTDLPEAIADRVCAIDMFFSVKDPTALLAELHRLCKPGGLLILDDGHQSRARTKQKLEAAGMWVIAKESKDHLKCSPK